MRNRSIWIALFLLLGIVNYANSSGVLRLILPTLTDLVSGGFSTGEGELAYDETKKKVIYHDGTDFVEVVSNPEINFNEYLPKVKKFHATDIKVEAGFVYINGEKYVNSSEITCAISSSGLGGLDTGSWSSYKKYSLYLIPDPTTGYETNFNCVFSESHTGPVSPYDSEWKRVLTFDNYISANTRFLSQNGKTKYFGKGVQVIYQDGMTSGCQKVVGSGIMPVSGIVGFRHDICPNTNNFGLFHDSSCTVPVSSCSSPLASFSGDHEEFYVNYLGSYSNSLTIDLISFDQDILESSI